MDGSWNRSRPTPSDLWPGASRLWYRGELRGLMLAAVFAVVVNTAILCTVTWSQVISLPGRWGALATLVAFWLLGLVDSMRARRRWMLAQQSDPQLDLFLNARTEYLRSNHSEAEALLEQLLHQATEDVEARLLLATLYRHQGRWHEAKEQLRRLQRWRDAGRWNMEIRREWEQLSRSQTVVEQDFSAVRRLGLTRSRPKLDDKRANEAA